MLEVIGTQEPLLINTIGHSVGLLLFAGFLVLVLQDRQRRRSAPGNLAVVTAALALLWNVGSLAVLAGASGLIAIPDAVAGLCFCVLSLLPAVLLQLSLNGRGRPIWALGYIVSGLAVGLHIAELFWPDSRLHQAALWTIIVGFGALTTSAMFLARRSRAEGGRSGRRIAVSMCLFLFAISFAHFSSGHVRYAWSREIAIHHAGIPLALFVLMQDYRFLLLDGFIRFLTNGVVVSGFLGLCLVLNSRFQILYRAGGNPFVQGVLLVATCLSLVILVFVRGKLQLLLTRVVFGRQDRESALREIRVAGGKADSERGFLDDALRIVAVFVRASRCELRQLDSWENDWLPDEPALITDTSLLEERLRLKQPWVEVAVPLRFIKGDGILLLLGRREGGRRYLSEDLQELSILAAVILDHLERLRNSEIQRLVSQAELRALQSQINPHFLFNSLNTLYGSIPREASEARQLVLNLAGMFRYFLQSDRPYISVSEEVQIVTAYLQIETLRLGDRLKTEVHVEESAGSASIPILSIQPLVENAVKHGVASRGGFGTVRLCVRNVDAGVQVEVSDDGEGFPPPHLRRSAAGAGVGLENVRQRLRLCFGDSARLDIDSTGHGSTVRFVVPARESVV